MPFIWPTAGIILGALISVNPFYHPHVTLGLGIAAWLADIALVLILSMHSLTARAGILVAGMFLAVPCFLRESAVWRGLLMCGMAFPLAIAAAPLVARPTATFWERLAHLLTWLGTREVKRRPRSFAIPSLLQLLAATVVFAAMMALVKTCSRHGFWLPFRWLSGGIMILAAAEMLTAGHEWITSLLAVKTPALMQSPFLSTSVGEFWTKRWNPAASFLLFRTIFFAPLARQSAALALWAAFFASAVAHVLLPYMATGKLLISLMCGAFFLTQPLLIAAERWMRVRRCWQPAAARVWTLMALAITSPLFVEPALQLIEPSWGAPANWLSPTLAMLGFVMGLNVLFSLGSLAVRSELTPPKVTGANAGRRYGIAGKSRVALRHRPGVAQFVKA